MSKVEENITMKIKKHHNITKVKNDGQSKNDFLQYGGGKKRNSSIEILRIISMYGIVLMHSFSIFYSSATGINLLFGVFINSICNMSVTIFMLISGYYGIKWSEKKMCFLWLEVFFYSIVELIIIGFKGTVNLKEIYISILPVSSKKFWFISSYLIIMIFSKYINGISETLDKYQFKVLLTLMLIIFSLIPTVTKLQIMNDGGKGPINMFFAYLIGRYIRKYIDVYNISNKNCLIGLLGFIGIETLGNYILSIIFKRGNGLYCPFAQDYSFFIIGGSICVFILFAKHNYVSRKINKLSRYVVAVYLMEYSLRILINDWLFYYKGASYLILILIIFSIFIMSFCIIIDMIRIFATKKLDSFIYYHFFSKFCTRVKKLFYIS